MSCIGVHKEGVNTGATGGTDSWTCTSLTGTPLANTTPGQVFNVGWYSDYYNIKSNGTDLRLDSDPGAHIVVSADGMSETGVASYNA